MKKLTIPLIVLVANLAFAEPTDFDRRLFHAPPKPLSPEAVTEDWPRFLGPRHDLHSRETKLLKSWPADFYLKLIFIIQKKYIIFHLQFILNVLILNQLLVRL